MGDKFETTSKEIKHNHAFGQRTFFSGKAPQGTATAKDYCTIL
jgi:hypothetical protein